MNKNELTLEWVIENLPIEQYFRGSGIDCLMTTENKIKVLIRKALEESGIDYIEFDCDDCSFDGNSLDIPITNFEFEIDALQKGYPTLYKKLLLNDFHVLLCSPYIDSTLGNDFESIWTLYNEQIDDEKEMLGKSESIKLEA